jgi:hypothetical protein
MAIDAANLARINRRIDRLVEKGIVRKAETSALRTVPHVPA